MKDLDKDKSDLLFNIVTNQLDIWYIKQIWLSGRSCRWSLMSDFEPKLSQHQNEWMTKYGELPSFEDVDEMFSWLKWYETTFDEKEKVENWFKQNVY